MVMTPERTTSTEHGGQEPTRSSQGDVGTYSLVCTGWMPWGTSWKRNQSMLSELSKLPMFRRAVFVNPRPLWAFHELWRGDGNLSNRMARLVKAIPHTYDRRIRICNKFHFIPFKHQFPAGARFEDWLFRSLVRWLRGTGPFILLNNHPHFFSQPLLVELMDQAALSVFDMSDDFVEYFQIEEHRRQLEENIEFCWSNSDVVFAINEHVKRKYGKHNPNAYVIPNATNYFNFDRPRYHRIPFLEAIKAKGQPILGYTGIINRVRIDYELLETVLRARQDCQFVFVGSTDTSFAPIAAKYPNVHYHRQVHYGVLPDWISYFDATIVPFQVNEHTRGNDLLKFNDYLAMGKSIVTTNTGGASKYDGLVRIASDAESFLACIEQSLRGDASEVVVRRKNEARRNSWDRRVREVESILREHLASNPPERTP